MRDPREATGPRARTLRRSGSCEELIPFRFSWLQSAVLRVGTHRDGAPTRASSPSRIRLRVPLRSRLRPRRRPRRPSRAIRRPRSRRSRRSSDSIPSLRSRPRARVLAHRPSPSRFRRPRAQAGALDRRPSSRRPVALTSMRPPSVRRLRRRRRTRGTERVVAQRPSSARRARSKFRALERAA